MWYCLGHLWHNGIKYSLSNASKTHVQCISNGTPSIDHIPNLTNAVEFPCSFWSLSPLCLEAQKHAGLDRTMMNYVCSEWISKTRESFLFLFDKPHPQLPETAHRPLHPMWPCRYRGNLHIRMWRSWGWWLPPWPCHPLGRPESQVWATPSTRYPPAKVAESQRVPRWCTILMTRKGISSSLLRQNKDTYPIVIRNLSWMSCENVPFIFFSQWHQDVLMFMALSIHFKEFVGQCHQTMAQLLEGA